MKEQLLSFFFIVIIFIGVQTAKGQTYYISTVAGDRVAGFTGDGAAATAAELDDPLNTTTDKFGNLYIADNFNYRVRKVDTNGVISTFAGDGSGTISGDGGPATLAGLGGLSTLAFDDTGNLYIGCGPMGIVRKVDTSGVITTFAGGGGSLGDGGPATDAYIGNARGVVADNSGNIYIVDQLNDRIRIVNTNGIISTFAGDGMFGYSGDGGQAIDAELDDPSEIAIDDSGNIYIDDSGNSVVRKVNTKGIISTVAGDGIAGYSGDGGQATDAELNDLLGLAIDNVGNIYIPDYLNQRVRKVDVATGIITTIAGTGAAGYSGDGGPATAAELSGPIGASADAFNNIYITEYVNGNNDVRKLGACSLAFTLNPPVPPPICNGQSIVLTAGGASTYQWSPSAGLNTTSGDTVLASPAITATYSVTATNTSGCSATKSIVITVQVAPPLVIQPQSPSVCPGQSVALSVPVSGTDYAWSPASTLSSSTADTVVASPPVQTTYLVTGTDSLGCAVSDSDVVSISSAPNKPTISTYENNLISSATQGNQWVRNDTALAGATNQTYTVTMGGYYQVIASNPANGCSTESDSSFVTGVNQLTMESGQVTVYPNPTGGIVFININSSAMNVNDWYLQVTDVLGRTLLTKTSLNYGNEIDLSNLSSGVYFICVINKMGRVVVPVVKQ